MFQSCNLAEDHVSRRDVENMQARSQNSSRQLRSEIVCERRVSLANLRCTRGRKNTSKDAIQEEMLTHQADLSTSRAGQPPSRRRTRHQGPTVGKLNPPLEAKYE
ncbi:hypothetical protein EVAR_101550_1 [Eumeta japonica]|uniref:Uncharacterized protein n=1 Tax=Eumeta variegata TaxID=151549 RepID=A0A4C1SLZ2_EUMVA|nr:hypothetical protein EVAR_101550_1 [Eumeta japonica]